MGGYHQQSVMQSHEHTCAHTHTLFSGISHVFHFLLHLKCAHFEVWSLFINSLHADVDSACL